MAKQPRPKACCTECGTVSIYSEHIGQRCAARSRTGEGGRCEGRFKAATAWDDWIACAACRATGEHEGEACVQCAGDGWHYRLRPGAPTPVPARRPGLTRG
ncbi:MAG: hypothetical protein HY060_18965 [Proteobacteria bacterium]|nr:hypothetical protein [Pseudomonadota bacterium]